MFNSVKDDSVDWQMVFFIFMSLNLKAPKGYRDNSNGGHFRF